MIPDVGVKIGVEIPLHLSPQVIVILYGQKSSCWWQSGKDTIWMNKFLLVANLSFVGDLRLTIGISM